MNLCIISIICSLICIVFTVIGILKLKNQNKKNILYSILVALILCVSLLGIGYYYVFYGYSENAYYYSIGIETNNHTNYTILLPIPDERIIEEISYPGVNFRIEETKYGKALNITSDQSFNVTVWVDDAESCVLSSESEPALTYFIYLNKGVNDSINLDFNYIPYYYGEDFDDIRFNSELEEGWHEYIFKSVWS